MTEWRDLPGFEGFYQVSDTGIVRSLPRVVHGRGGKRLTVRGRILRQSATKPADRSHMHVAICRDGKRWTITVHKLVALAFMGSTPAGLVVCHNNGDGADNRLSNLRFDTQKENILDKVRHGTHHEANKTQCPQGHDYDEANTYHRPNRIGRNCRACGRAVTARVKAEKRAALLVSAA